MTVVEKHARVGGRTATLEQDGFKFDIGPTFFLYPRVLKEIFADAGYDLDREVPMKRLDPQYRLVFGGGGTDRRNGGHRAHGAADCGDLAWRCRGVQELFDAQPQEAGELSAGAGGSVRELADLMKPELMKLLPLMKPWLSLDGDLRTHFKDERIRLGFSFQSKYLGMSPFRCPSLFSILSFLEYEHGVFHPIGGCGAVTQAMARICTRDGRGDPDGRAGGRGAGR